MERSFLCWLALSALGCGGLRSGEAAARPFEARAAAAPAIPPARASAAAEAAPVPPRAPSSRDAAIRLEALAPSPERSSVPRVEIVEPRFGDHLAPLAIREQPVRLRITGAGEGDRVLISLDGGRPRPQPKTGVLRLGQLLAEDAPVTEGRHVLLAVAVDRDGLPLRVRPPGVGPFSVVDFAVGEGSRASEPRAEPRVFCLGPAGTFHGAETDRLVLSLLVVGAGRGKLPLSITGRAVEFAATIDPTLPHAVSGLPSGDVRFAVAASPSERAECVATLNPDPVEPAPR